tara:strand:- start:397 stop:738 length:342 start_codon:yes stop_codon:yes gene_type:complete
MSIFSLNIPIFLLIILFSISCDNKENIPKKLYSKDICSEKIAPFYFENNSTNSTNDLKKLCTCLWNKLPEGGWERKTSSMLHKGEDIGWKIKSFSTIFEFNYKNCLNEIVINE